ncbi:hypothetical protein WMY93_021579 [Mugilogobius chulae]|uniref:Uncharacterized protein n=1 Tax=Mugilogobius chulae TaxID=88201 RepID=A0AAW0NL80_9GOBI
MWLSVLPKDTTQQQSTLVIPPYHLACPPLCVRLTEHGSPTSSIVRVCGTLTALVISSFHFLLTQLVSSVTGSGVAQLEPLTISHFCHTQRSASSVRVRSVELESTASATLSQPGNTMSLRKFKAFKWLGSLTSLPFRRSTDKSGCTSADGDKPSVDTVVEAAVDDLEATRPRTASYVRSSEGYSHVGTLPRLLRKKRDKSEKDCPSSSSSSKKTKDKSLYRSQSHCCDRDTTHIHVQTRDGPTTDTKIAESRPEADPGLASNPITPPKNTKTEKKRPETDPGPASNPTTPHKNTKTKKKTKTEKNRHEVDPGPASDLDPTAPHKDICQKRHTNLQQASSESVSPSSDSSAEVQPARCETQEEMDLEERTSPGSCNVDLSVISEEEPAQTRKDVSEQTRRSSETEDARLKGARRR